MTRDSREFEVVVWGATGFTGGLTAEYLLDRHGAQGALRCKDGFEIVKRAQVVQLPKVQMIGVQPF